MEKVRTPYLEARQGKRELTAKNVALAALAGHWSFVANALNSQLQKGQDTGRIGKQCRERYCHHLRPDLNKVKLKRKLVKLPL